MNEHSGLAGRASALLLTGVVATGAAAQQPAKATPPLVFDLVTVVDVEHGTLLPGQRVVVRGNRIQAVGPRRAVVTPKGARIVDARGKYLIPGLWDMHIHPYHFTRVFYPLLIANGVTGIRDPKSDVSLDSLLRWRQEILAGTRVGPPRQLLAGPIATLRTVDSLKAAGANFLKTYPYTPELAAAIRRVGLPFGGHIDTDISTGSDVIAASDGGISIVDHARAPGGLDTLCLGLRASVARCQPVAEHFRRNGTWWVPTLSLFSIEPRARAHTNMFGLVFQTISERFQEFAHRYWAGAAVRGDWLHDVVDVAATIDVESWIDASEDGATVSPRFSLIRRLGLPLLAGTDTYALHGQENCRYNPPGFSLPFELALYVAEGLTPLEALQSATLNPARLLHGTDSLGTVASGKLADLVLLDANPLADIANVASIRAVVANGRYYNRATLDHLLAVGRMLGKQDFRWFGEAH